MCLYHMKAKSLPEEIGTNQEKVTLDDILEWIKKKMICYKGWKVKADKIICENGNLLTSPKLKIHIECEDFIESRKEQK